MRSWCPIWKWMWLGSEIFLRADQSAWPLSELWKINGSKMHSYNLAFWTTVIKSFRRLRIHIGIKRIQMFWGKNRGKNRGKWKGRQSPGIKPRTLGLCCQYSAIEPRQLDNNHNPLYVLPEMLQSAHLAATQYLIFQEFVVYPNTSPHTMFLSKQTHVGRATNPESSLHPWEEPPADPTLKVPYIPAKSHQLTQPWKFPTSLGKPT